MEIIWLVIETLRESVHDDITLNYTKIKCVPSEFNRDEMNELFALQDLVLIDSFKTEKEARAFGQDLLKKSAQDYTRVLNKLPDLGSVMGRPFLVQITEEVTKSPRVYLMKKVDYEKLKATFSTVRLASDEEIESAKSFISCLIPLDYKLLKSLRLQYFRVISPPDGLLVERYYEFCEGFEESQKMVGELREYCILLARGSELVLREDAISVAKKLFGERAEERVDQMIKFLQDIAAGREVDFSGNLTVNRKIEDDIDYGVEQVSVKYA